ncbi:proline-rich protein HaeIII subfamily 1-like [Pithys albifrons albifrons]|uniref:proline-rich protein HaeIII subfamily 1-like n=1 Tax=Pithys albifrons albifrons TaxID=3385563 RepID=UPI003A5CCC8E
MGRALPPGGRPRAHLHRPAAARRRQAMAIPGGPRPFFLPLPSPPPLPLSLWLVMEPPPPPLPALCPPRCPQSPLGLSGARSSSSSPPRFGLSAAAAAARTWGPPAKAAASPAVPSPRPPGGPLPAACPPRSIRAVQCGSPPAGSAAAATPQLCPCVSPSAVPFYHMSPLLPPPEDPHMPMSEAPPTSKYPVVSPIYFLSSYIRSGGAAHPL